MRNKLLEMVDAKSVKPDLLDLKIGQNVKVSVKIKEGSKERIQVFEGLVIALKSTGANKTITVRKISYGIGIERTFLLNSPLIVDLQVVKTNKIRRAKLYYMRNRFGKSSRLKEVKKVRTT